MPHILIIDDERNVRFLIEKFLEGFTYDSLSTVEEALKNIFEKNINYDLIISDLKLPGKSGIELVKALREKAIDTPILIVSAYTKPEILSELFKFERVDFLSKPFTKEELLSKVKELVDEPKESFDRALRMANEFLNSGDLNKAEKLIKKMFSLSPSSPIPHYLMYELLKKRGNLELANKHLNAAKSLDENIEVKKDEENK